MVADYTLGHGLERLASVLSVRLGVAPQIAAERQSHRCGSHPAWTVARPSRPCRAVACGVQRTAFALEANLDLAGSWVMAHCEHTLFLLVENWEAFEAVHQVTFDVSCASNNPLVVIRGSPAYRPDHASAMLDGLGLPVFALVDYDLAGLPHFFGLMAQAVLEGTALPEIVACCEPLQADDKALSQEYFLIPRANC